MLCVKKFPVILAVLSTCLALSLLASPLLAGEQPRSGGTIRFMLEAEPPTLDPHFSTSTVTSTVGMHWLETLFTLGSKYEIIPDLAESYTLSDDLKVYNIKLRQGVLFHNSKEMTSEDVVSSVIRWGKVANYGKALFKNVSKIETVGKYQVRVTMKDGSVVLPAFLTWTGRAPIYPKEVIEEAGEGHVKTRIGSGPYQLMEHRPDRYIRLKRFDKYVPRPEPPNGYGGKRTAYIDEIMMIVVPEQAQRINMVQAGELDFSDWITPDALDRLKADPNIDTLIVKPKEWIYGGLNQKTGPFTNKTLRLAAQAALDMKPIMTNAVGRPEFFRLDPGVMFKESVWWSDASQEYYNQANKEKARKLMQEAGYKGEKIRWICTKHYEWMYQSAAVGAQQLKEVGFNIDLQVMEWASMLQQRNNPDIWEMFTTGLDMPADPSQHLFLNCSWGGWNCFPELENLVKQFSTTAAFPKRYEIWKKIQTYFYENALAFKFGDFFTLRIKRNYVKGYSNMTHAFLWNAWLDK